MDGKADHALTVSGYSMHFCSDHCRENFSKDTAKKILALKTSTP
jgi:YHS domain-containing protein